MQNKVNLSCQVMALNNDQNVLQNLWIFFLLLAKMCLLRSTRVKPEHVKIRRTDRWTENTFSTGTNVTGTEAREENGFFTLTKEIPPNYKMWVLCSPQPLGTFILMFLGGKRFQCLKYWWPPF